MAKKRKSKSQKAKERQRQKATEKRQHAEVAAVADRTKSDIQQLDAKKEEAAQLLAENDFTVEEIAEKLGVARSTIYEWRALPDFSARVAALEKMLGDISLRRIIARKSRRLLALEDRWLRMQRVIEERAANPAMQNAPGGKTGMLVRRQRMLGSGPAAKLIEEFEFDAALEKALRETEKQAAQECGQWEQRDSKPACALDEGADDKHQQRMDALAFYCSIRDDLAVDSGLRMKAQQSIDRLLGLIEHAPRNLESICEQLGISLETLRQLVAGDLPADETEAAAGQPVGEVPAAADPLCGEGAQAAPVGEAGGNLSSAPDASAQGSGEGVP
jgi:transposase-like protein